MAFRLTILGTSSALPTSDRYPTAHVLNVHERLFLIDCGEGTQMQMRRYKIRFGKINHIFISHLHGDHFFGLPYLLARMQEQGRARPLFVHGGAGVAEKVAMVADLAYPGLRGKLDYELVCLEARPEEPFVVAGFSALAALTGHGAPCLGVRLTTRFGALYYGGDGAALPAGRELASGCALVVQEGYGLEAGVPGHGSVPEALDLAESGWAEALAVVHVRRELRRERGEEIGRQLGAASIRAFLPEPGDVFEV